MKDVENKSSGNSYIVESLDQYRYDIMEDLLPVLEIEIYKPFHEQIINKSIEQARENLLNKSFYLFYQGLYL